MPDGRIEIITGRKRRRRWSTAAKLRLVAESQEPGASMTAVAARHDVYPSLVFKWRRQVREGRLPAVELPGFAPGRLAGPARRGGEETRPSAASDEPGASGIAIVLSDGTRLHISHAAQRPLLRGVLGVLRQ